ncbi:unnamed protein product [Brachionus calyciflorus]|uniref:Uncharacterized protein n=1 Tax=Brachionus calyciflorus TaxID=104777 RepID=A0A814A1B7_9BILA|nr:unnamed protein product [Brachionus calyciflorus]
MDTQPDLNISASRYIIPAPSPILASKQAQSISPNIATELAQNQFPFGTLKRLMKMYKVKFRVQRKEEAVKMYPPQN